MKGSKQASRRRVDALLGKAEAAETCLVPQNDSDRRCLRREARQPDSMLVSPVPRTYARRSTWSQLTPSEQAVRMMRGVRALRPNVVFCAQSAALVWGLPVSWTLLPTVHVARLHDRRSCSVSGVCEHEIRGPIHPRRRNGLTVTDFWRTVFDCLRTFPFPDALAVADGALRQSSCDRLGMIRLLERRFRGCKGIRRAISICQWAEPAAENGGESVARAHMILCGYDPPHLQLTLPRPLDERRSFRIDFSCRNVWQQLVFIELDGAVKYGDGGEAEEARRLERRREALLTSYNARFVRLSLREAVQHDTLCALLDLQGIPRGVPPELEYGDVPFAPPKMRYRETTEGQGTLQLGPWRTHFSAVNVRRAA